MPTDKKKKYTSKEVIELARKGKLNPATLKVEDFTSKKEHEEYFLNNSYRCNTKNCAEWAHDAAGDIIGLTGNDKNVFSRAGYEIGLSGNAWQNYGNIIEAKGADIYNSYNNTGGIEDLKVGDIIGLGKGRAVPGSAYLNTGSQPNAGVDNSHTGIVSHIDDEGAIYVSHNIGRAVWTDRIVPDKNGGYALSNQVGLNGWSVATAARPNYTEYPHADIEVSEDGTPAAKQYTLEEAGYNENAYIKSKVDSLRRQADDRKFTPNEIKEAKKKYNIKEGKGADALAKRKVLEEEGEDMPVKDNENLQQFITSLNKNKKELMTYYKLTEDEFNDMAINAIAITGQESRFGTSKKQWFKDNNDTLTQLLKLGMRGEWSPEEELSKGMGQVKPYSISPDFMKEFGIIPDDDDEGYNFANPDKQALLVMSHLVGDKRKVRNAKPDNNLPPFANDEESLSTAAYSTPNATLTGQLTYNESMGGIEGIENQRLRNIEKNKAGFAIWQDNKVIKDYTYTDLEEKLKIADNNPPVQLKEGGILPPYQPKIKTLENGRPMKTKRTILPSFITPLTTRRRKKYEEGGGFGFDATGYLSEEELLGDSGDSGGLAGLEGTSSTDSSATEALLEGIGSYGSEEGKKEGEQSDNYWENADGDIINIGAAVQSVNSVVSKDKTHGVSETSYTVDKVAESTHTGYEMGKSFGPLGMIWGAALGATYGNIAGVIEARDINSKYSKQFKQDYQEQQANATDDNLFAREGGQLPAMKQGGNIDNFYTEFNGNTHENGGIPLGEKAEVEDKEVRWDNYIFSDTLTLPSNYKI